MIEEINNAKYWFFGRINKIEDPKRTVDFLLLLVFPAECACMNWLTQVLDSHGVTGGSRGEHVTASTAPLFQTSIHSPLTAGSCGHSAPGRSGHESPTPGNACSHPSGDHTPAHTENLGSQETGSKPSCGRKEADCYPRETRAW